MPRPKTVSMRATNAVLSDAVAVGDVLPSETALASVHNVSRSAMRAALARLTELGVLERDDRKFVFRRLPVTSDWYGTVETESRAHFVERRFMEMTLGGELLPGTHLSEADFARRIGVSTVTVREFLIGFTRYGLIEREARGGWRLCTFDAAFGRELAGFRRLLELDAIRQFSTLATNDPAWAQVEALRVQHLQTARKHRDEPRLFSELDREFHRFLIGRLHNRFAEGFYGVVALVFHYHYQWDKRDEATRNAVALKEHQTILEALARRDVQAAEHALQLHLDSALRTLLASLAAPGNDIVPHSTARIDDAAAASIRGRMPTPTLDSARRQGRARST